MTSSTTATGEVFLNSKRATYKQLLYKYIVLVAASFFLVVCFIFAGLFSSTGVAAATKNFISPDLLPPTQSCDGNTPGFCPYGPFNAPPSEGGQRAI
jgi:hypothetical protein